MREPASLRHYVTTSFCETSFIILRSGKGLTSFNKENSAKFSGEKKKKKVQCSFAGCLSFENRDFKIQRRDGHENVA